MSHPQQGHLKRLHARLRKNPRNYFQAEKKRAAACGNDIVFNGSFVRLQPSQARRRGVFLTHRLYRRLGTFPYFRLHISDGLLAELRDYLRDIGHAYADRHRFGQGPNWRMRATRVALDILGFDPDMLRHGIEREVFLCQLASNAVKILRNGRGRPNLCSLLSAGNVAQLAVERWMLPRSLRMPEFRTWRRENIRELLGEQYRTLPYALRAHA
jgi:hypothetical protein